MKSFGSHDAKAHWARLLVEVEHGAEVVITRRGKAVARLVPAARQIDAPRLERAVEGLKRFRYGRRLGDIGIKELIHQGRP